MQAEVEPTISRWFPPETVKANPPHLDVLRKMILETPVDGFAGCSAALANHDYRPGMKNVKNPVLYMCGEKDGNNTAVMRTMQQEFPAAKYVELPGAGHISNMDRPALFTEALREFLRLKHRQRLALFRRREGAVERGQRSARPVSRRARRCSRADVRRFAAFGIAMTPSCCSSHASATCAGVAPTAFATFPSSRMAQHAGPARSANRP